MFGTNEWGKLYILEREFIEVRLLIELVEQFTQKIAVCKVLLKLFDWLYKIIS
jgi:hypothetical protein